MSKAVACGICAVVFLGVFFPIPFASAQTVSSADLQALVRQLQEQITTLQFQVQELKTQLATTKEEAAVVKQEVAATKQDVAEVKQELQLTRSLQRGVRGDDVRKLQEFLSQFSDIYPQGLTTGFYGPATEAAVRRLQAKHGIEQLGVIGPKTIAKINELITEGAGRSGVIPPGLLRAPGIQKKIGETTISISATTTPATRATTTPVISTEPIGQTGTTTTPVIPALPASEATSTAATPVVPAQTPTPISPPPLSISTTTTATTTVVTSPADTTAPILSNIQATNITATSAVITWNTDESADSQVEHGLTTSYGSQTVLDANRVISHSAMLTGLTASTAYHYRVKSKDAAGNPATSADQTFTTAAPPTSLLAPLSMRWNWVGRITLPTITQNYQLIIYYPPSAIDAPASFNIYLKKSGESGFTKTNYPKSSLTKYVASSGSEASYSAYPLGNYGVPSDSIPLGEYKVYATAVDSAGIETAPTSTATGNYNPAPLIVNPANGSAQSSLSQINLSNRSSLANPRYTISLYGANGYIWAPNAFYGGSVTYNGPVLSSTNNPHTLVAGIFPSGTDPADSSPYTVNTFNIASAATTTASLDLRAKNLAAIARTLHAIQEQLTKLLHGF